MSLLLVASCYASATALSLYLLWHFGAKHWIWHALSAALAFTIGLVHLPAFFDTPEGTLMVGWVFVFLLIWGIAAPAVAMAHDRTWLRRHH